MIYQKQNKPPTQLRDNNTARQTLLFKNKKSIQQYDGISIEMRSVENDTAKSRSSQYSEMSQQNKVKKTSSKIQTIRHQQGNVYGDMEFYGSEVGDGKEYGVRDINKQKQTQKQNIYDIWDLTYTLISTKVPIGITCTMFIIFVVIRYYTVACLIYMATNSKDQDIMWIMVIVVDRALYAFLVMKISLENPETKTQIVLKSHWNSKQSEISQLFQVIDMKKLLVSILRGLIPAQLAFIYIKGQPRRRFQVYAAINYINASIQAIVYYPFFIIYCWILTADNTFALNVYYKGATIGFAFFAEFIMVVMTITLIFLGIEKKYGRILFCLGKQK